MTILIAEDSPVDAILLRNILAHAGHQVIHVRNGREALEQLAAHPEVALVMADVRMPELDGIGLHKALQDDPALERLPVLFVSGVADADVVRQVLSLGSKGYILKPVNEPSRVLERVAAALQGAVPVLEDEDAVRARTGVGVPHLRELRRHLLEDIRPLLGQPAVNQETVRPLRERAQRAGALRLTRALGEGASPDRLARELRATYNVLENGPAEASA